VRARQAPQFSRKVNRLLLFVLFRGTREP
jgi:hypothetical protein